jgi:hypothetical protein
VPNSTLVSLSKYNLITLTPVPRVAGFAVGVILSSRGWVVRSGVAWTMLTIESRLAVSSCRADSGGTGRSRRAGTGCTGEAGLTLSVGDYKTWLRTVVPGSTGRTLTKGLQPLGSSE